MAKVVFLIPPAHGHMNPTIGLANELADRGEEVIFFSSESNRRKVESLGASFRGYQDIGWYGDNRNLDIESYGIDGLIKQAGLLLMGGKKVSEIMMDKVAAEKPDYIIHDSYGLWGKLIAKQLSIPAITSIPSFALNKQMVELDPDTFIKYMLRSDDSTQAAKILSTLDNLTAIFKKRYDIEDFFDIFISKESLNITYTSRYFQPYQETFDDSFRFVGASIFQRHELFDFPFDSISDQPLIYIAMGNVVTNHSEFYQKCFAAFQDRNLQVVLSLGQADLPDSIKAPDNFIVRRLVPQLEILKRAAVFITHGGINSVCEGLYYNVPLIAVPFLGDQCMIAKRVSDLKSGIYVDYRKTNPEELRRAVDEVLQDPVYRMNSQKIGDSFRAAGGYQKAADEVLEFKRKHEIR
jgi:MGT family glycosyltransferase